NLVRTACLILLTLAVAQAVRAAEPVPVKKANYDLAAKWSSAKAGKLLYDSAVTPHWLEFSDRFWYSFNTSQGRKFCLVDPHAKPRKPLFDNARMASDLTKITLFPYDAQHLPIRTLKFIKKDTALQFEIEYPKDAEVRVEEEIKSVNDLGEDKT